MHRSNLAMLARFSTLLLLTLTAACLSGSSGSQGSRKPGSGGSGTGGGNGGNGGSAGSGGTSAGSGGVTPGNGGSAGSGGTSAGSGGVTPGTGGSAGGGGTSAGSGGVTPGTGGSAGGGGTSAGSGGRTGTGGSAGTTTSSGGRTGGGGVTPGTGGSAGSGGSGDTSGGRTGTGGSAGAGGGSAGSGGIASGTGGGAGSSSSFTVKVELSTAIPTVGIATWSLDDPIDSATIDFGRDQSSFELQAPVDLAAENHRTLLLGMKQNTTYYVRVTANGGGQTYVSQVASLKTGSLSAGLPVATVTDRNASALYARGGFTVSCMGWATSSGPRDGGSTGSWAFILDPDGDMVWAYDLSKTVAPQCTRARMSLDGKYMWANNFGNTTPDGALARIAMDGLGTPGAYSLPGSNHDFAILPDDHVVYIVRDNGGSGMQPESLFELDPSTSQTKLIYRETTDFGSLFDTQGGHTNQVNYVPDLKAISFSMYFINTIGLVSYPEAKLLAAFGGDNSTFSAMSWTGQHGHDVYRDHIVLFNNEGTNGARTIRFKYDLQAKTATEEASYSCGLSTRALGDVKELPNGNYFVTYSMIGTMHEIDSSMKLLREVETGASIGYVEHRASLYGRPPPYDR